MHLLGFLFVSGPGGGGKGWGDEGGFLMRRSDIDGPIGGCSTVLALMVFLLVSGLGEGGWGGPRI